jgi:uncharacterized protein involved in exopolysaccharide biosynthesis
MSYNSSESSLYSSFPPPQRLPAPLLEARDFLKRNALLIAGISVTIAFWIGLYAWFVFKPHYSSKAVVIIKDSAVTSRYVQPDHNYVTQTTSSSSSNPVLNSMALLKANSIGEALWDYFQDEHPEELKKMHIRSHRQWDNVFQDGSGFVKAKNLPGTDLISVQFSWSQAAIAKDGLDTVIQAFQESSRNLNRAEEVSRTRYLSRQSQDLAEQLKQIRHRKSLYRAKIGTVSMAREQDDLAASRLDLANKLNQVEAQARGKESQTQNYQRVLGMNSIQALRASAVGQNTTMSKLQDELYRLKQLYSVLHTSLSDMNPKIREVRAQIAEVQANIQTENSRTLGADAKNVGSSLAVADTTRSQAVGDLLKAQSEAQDLRSQAHVMRSRLGQVDHEIRTYPAFAEEMSNLEEQESSLSAALDQLRQKVIESRIKEEQTLSNVFIVDSPRLPEKPQFPTQIHLTILGLLLGLGTGVAVAFARERLFLSQSEPTDDEDDDDHLPPSSGNTRRKNGWLDPLSSRASRRQQTSRPFMPPAGLNMATPELPSSTHLDSIQGEEESLQNKEETSDDGPIHKSAALHPEQYDWEQSFVPSFYALNETAAFPELADLQQKQGKRQAEKISWFQKAFGAFRRFNEHSVLAVVTLARRQERVPVILPSLHQQSSR